MLARGGELRMKQRIAEILLNDDKTARLPTRVMVTTTGVLLVRDVQHDYRRHIALFTYINRQEPDLCLDSIERSHARGLFVCVSRSYVCGP